MSALIGLLLTRVVAFVIEVHPAARMTNDFIILRHDDSRTIGAKERQEIMNWDSLRNFMRCFKKGQMSRSLKVIFVSTLTMSSVFLSLFSADIRKHK